MNAHDAHIDPDVAAFRAEVEAFLARTEMPPSRFGREARNDSRFVVDLRNGRAPDYQTRAEVRAWMEGWQSASLPVRQAG